MSGSPRYSTEPVEKRAYTESFDRAYSRWARMYDLAVRAFPAWRRWLGHAQAAVEGPRTLEVSFGTGWLLTQYAGRVEAHGVDFNRRMVGIAARNLERAGVHAELICGDVNALPYGEATFDTVVNTMAFSGYPDGNRAMSELHRVLRPGGRLVMIDVAYPRDGNRPGSALVGLWRRSGDIVRDMFPLFASFDFEVTEEEIGGWGSVHLWIARKRGG